MRTSRFVAQNQIHILLASICLLIGISNVQAQAPIRPKTSPPDKNSPIAPPTTVTTEARLPASFAITRWKGLPSANISLNDSLSEYLVFDTGLDKNVVLPGASLRLNLPKMPEVVRVATLDSALEGAETVIDRIRFSSILIKDTHFALVDAERFLSLKPQPDAPAAWLGMQFLATYQVTFDFPKNTITLYKPLSPLPKGRDSVVMPLEIINGKPFVKVSVPGSKPFLALLDTGSPGTLMPASVAEKLKLKPIRTDTFTRLDAKDPKIVKEGKAALILLPKFNLGKIECKNQRVVYLTAESAPEFDRNTAIIGMDILNSYRVTLNFERKQVQFTPPLVEQKEL